MKDEWKLLIGWIILVTLLLLSGCASMLQVPKYGFMDMSGKMHSYKKEIKGLNKTVTYYCQKHYEWETIAIRYTKNGREYRVR